MSLNVKYVTKEGDEDNYAKYPEMAIANDAVRLGVGWTGALWQRDLKTTTTTEIEEHREVGSSEAAQNAYGPSGPKGMGGCAKTIYGLDTVFRPDNCCSGRPGTELCSREAMRTKTVDPTTGEDTETGYLAPYCSHYSP